MPKGNSSPRYESIDEYRQAPESAGYLIELFIELRDLGARPDPEYFKSWEEMTSVELSLWEKETLIHMLNAYVRQGRSAIDPKCPDPLETPDERRIRANKEMLERWL